MKHIVIRVTEIHAHAESTQQPQRLAAFIDKPHRTGNGIQFIKYGIAEDNPQPGHRIEQLDLQCIGFLFMLCICSWQPLKSRLSPVNAVFVIQRLGGRSSVLSLDLVGWMTKITHTIYRVLLCYRVVRDRHVLRIWGWREGAAFSPL